MEHLSSRTRYEWLAQLNTEYRPKKAYRRTSIIGTIGQLLASSEDMSPHKSEITNHEHETANYDQVRRRIQWRRSTFFVKVRLHTVITSTRLVLISG